MNLRILNKLRSISVLAVCLAGLSLSPADAHNTRQPSGRHNVAPCAVNCDDISHYSPKIKDWEVLSMMLTESPAYRLVPDTISMVFIGDIMLHASQIENTSRTDGSFDFSGYFPGLKDDLESADLAIANMEFTLAGAPYSGYPAFCAPDAYAEYMADCGIDIFLTANNHILDKGVKGLERTLEVYREMEHRRGIKITGSAENAVARANNNPLIVNSGKFKIAFVNCTYGTNLEPDRQFPGTLYMHEKETIAVAIQRAKAAGSDLIVALPHWGLEYFTKHHVDQQAYARWLAELGADIIIGAHPHVVQDADTLTVTCDGVQKRVPVIYSLGNAISNMSAENTQVGLMVKLQVTKNSAGDAVILPPEYVFTWCSLPGRLTGSHTTVKISDYLGKRDAWIQPYEYDKMVKTYYNILEQTGLQPGR